MRMHATAVVVLPNAALLRADGDRPGYTESPRALDRSLSDTSRDPRFTPPRSRQQQLKRTAHSKPMLIAETAASEDGGKPAWISGMFESLQTMPAVKGLLWCERYDDQRPTDL